MGELTSGIGVPQDSITPQAQRPTLTFGQKAVGLTFNPSNMPTVDRIKTLCAAIIDEIADQRAGNPNDERNPDKWEMFTDAIKSIKEGQMWAVKACTWQY